MERQYAKYDNTLVLKPIITPFQKPAEEMDDNSKLLRSDNIKTNTDYRRYMTSKADAIRERNTKNSI
jgi:hypothetical protein